MPDVSELWLEGEALGGFPPVHLVQGSWCAPRDKPSTIRAQLVLRQHPLDPVPQPAQPLLEALELGERGAASRPPG
jgi:hypothetical protein